MKKLLTGIVSTGLVLSLGILGVSAAAGSGQGSASALRDRDGSCVSQAEPAQTGDTGIHYRDDNPDGICDDKESASAVCVNDSDNNGVCDYREEGERPLDGSGARRGWQENSRPGCGAQGNGSQGGGMQYRRGR